MEKKVDEHEGLRDRLKREASHEKKELEQKFTAESDKLSQIQKRNWWNQALQLKVKNIISDKLKKSKMAAIQAKQTLE